jgi:hypothetical protein
MRKVFLLAATAFMLAGSVAYAGGKPAPVKKQKQVCTQCPKSCTGAKCAECCKNGQCVKGK